MCIMLAIWCMHHVEHVVQHKSFISGVSFRLVRVACFSEIVYVLANLLACQGRSRTGMHDVKKSLSTAQYNVRSLVHNVNKAKEVLKDFLDE